MSTDKEYYEYQISKIKDLKQISFKLTDFQGNSTNNLTLNEDSIKALLKLMELKRQYHEGGK